MDRNETPHVYHSELTSNSKYMKVKVRSTVEGKNGKEVVFKTYLAKYLQLINRQNFSTNINSIFSEITINMGIDHPNCMSCDGVKFDGENIILFFKEGVEDLQTFRQSKTGPNFRQLRQITDGVCHLHRKRILHGDIKPSNIIIFDDGTVKIGDYGKSVFIFDGNICTFSSKMYTTNYRAPEVWTSEEWGFPADIWSLACTFFYLIYGHSIFPEQSSDAGYISCLTSWEDNSSNLLGEQFRLPKEWTNPSNFFINSLIMRMLNPDPNERPTIFEVKQELDQGYDGLPMILSCSPDSVSEGFIPIMKDSDTVIYDRNIYVGPAKEYLFSIIKTKPVSYANLVVMIYSYLETDVSFNNDIYRISTIIANNLTGKPTVQYGITNSQIELFKSLLSSGKFDYFNWRLFLGSPVVI